MTMTLLKTSVIVPLDTVEVYLIVKSPYDGIVTCSCGYAIFPGFPMAWGPNYSLPEADAICGECARQCGYEHL